MTDLDPALGKHSNNSDGELRSEAPYETRSRNPGHKRKVIAA